jgi:hypothetical protein
MYCKYATLFFCIIFLQFELIKFPEGPGMPRIRMRIWVISFPEIVHGSSPFRKSGMGVDPNFRKSGMGRPQHPEIGHGSASFWTPIEMLAILTAVWSWDRGGLGAAVSAPRSWRRGLGGAGLGAAVLAGSRRCWQWWVVGCVECCVRRKERGERGEREGERREKGR